MESSFLLTLIVALMALALIAGFVGSLSGLGGGMFIVPALVIFAHEQSLTTTCVTASTARTFRQAIQQEPHSWRRYLTAAPMHWHA